MRERVTCIIGKKPIILICPHGCDDTNTDVITERAAQQLNCYAVINRGFERCENPDIDNDQADCNRINHVKEDVIYEEYLKPIIKFADRIANKGKAGSAYQMVQSALYGWDYETVHIFHIHGCGNIVHTEAGEPVELVVGYGLGAKKNSLSCELWRKNCFIDLYTKYAIEGAVYEGDGGGRYGGRDSNNMNQYFRKHDARDWVQSMQLEFPFSARDSESKAVSTAMMLSVVLGDYLKFDSYENERDEALMI
jgi:hypothetical protein